MNADQPAAAVWTAFAAVPYISLALEEQTVQAASLCKLHAVKGYLPWVELCAADDLCHVGSSKVPPDH